MLSLAKPDAIVMHPGPMNRGVEIDADIADGPQSVILDEVEAGVAVRMAVLEPGHLPRTRPTPKARHRDVQAFGRHRSHRESRRPSRRLRTRVSGVSPSFERYARRFPHEDIIYLGDTARVPYGTRSAATVVKYAMGCAQHLVARKVKALVIACNTVSAVAPERLRIELDLPVLGVIEPGARAAVAASRVGRIGLLATQATVASGAYPRAIAAASTRAPKSSRKRRRCSCRSRRKGGRRGRVPTLPVCAATSSPSRVRGSTSSSSDARTIRSFEPSSRAKRGR